MADRLVRWNMSTPRPIQDLGSGYLAGQGDGIVTVAGARASRPITVLAASSMRIVARTRSDDLGNWRVDNLNADRKYIVIAVDTQRQFNAVIRDNIQPAVAS